jgi:hypothetical protein
MFKVGDLVVGNNENFYSHTNKYMICRVVKIVSARHMHVDLVDSIYKDGFQYDQHGGVRDRLTILKDVDVRIGDFNFFRPKRSHYPSWF